ncbi:MAG: FCD domain-containing protein, partial [Gemmobacter sp.]|nr:FCD domain-containing protein [Gemmobacter sp.]
REVLNTLTVEGLLTRNPTTRALCVTRPSQDKISEIYRVRRLLETGGVTAFADCDDQALDPLVAATNRLVDAIDTGDYLLLVACDIDCHVELVALSGSSDLTEFYARLLAKLQLAMADVSRSPDYDLRALRDDHLMFVALLRSRRIEEAKAIILDRLNSAETKLLAAVAG